MALAVMAIGLSIATDTVDASSRKTYTVSNTPTRLLPVSGQSASITLTNTARNNIAFAAINLRVPAGLSVASPTLTTANGLGTVSLNTSTSTLELRNLNVSNAAPNNTVRVNFTIPTTITPTCQSWTFTSDVRQSNDFNGTLNQFNLVGSDATFTAPCSSSTVTCTAGDNQICSTGTIFGSSSSEAQVTVQDSDLISATLTASLTSGTLQCPEYTATSPQLDFDITITNGANTNGVTKTVDFSGPVTAGDTREAWEYQVCFAAPYDFPAQLPSQLFEDFNTGVFSGNTTFDGTEYRGLLLPCTAGKGAPCISSRTISDGRVAIKLLTPVADPRTRY